MARLSIGSPGRRCRLDRNRGWHDRAHPWGRLIEDARDSAGRFWARGTVWRDPRPPPPRNALSDRPARSAEWGGHDREGAHVRITDIEYSHRGRRLVGQLAVDDRRIGARPAVLVCHEGNGLSEHSKRVAERLAELGYVAFALDYYGDGAVLAPEDMPDRFAEISSDPELTRGIAAAGLAELLACEYTDPTRVAAIGFCFGGTMALELAR